MINENPVQKEFVWGVILGGTLASLGVLLFTTKKGQRLQKQIAEFFEEAGEEVKEGVAKAAEQTAQKVK